MILNLHIIGQKIYCDEAPFLATESKNYLKCEFEFSTDWEGCIKTAIFRGVTGVPYCIEIEDDACTVPHEVLRGNVFLISVFGILDDKRITTNTVDIYVKDSGYAEGETPPEPTPTVYEKMLKELHTISTIQQEELDKKVDKATTLVGYGITDAYTKEDVDRMEASMSKTINTHTTDTDIHITSDERTLWNTVSKKANKSDIGDRSGLPIPDETIVDNISFVKSCIDANNEEMSGTFFDRMVAVDTQINNIQSELEDLQTQMGDIETVLDVIITIQNTLIGGDAV